MIEARKAVIEDIGSCTALLVDEIQKLDIDITPLEATVMALGIYADTNCLTLPKTSSKDAYALAPVPAVVPIAIIGRVADVGPGVWQL